MLYDTCDIPSSIRGFLLCQNAEFEKQFQEPDAVTMGMLLVDACQNALKPMLNPLSLCSHGFRQPAMLIMQPITPSGSGSTLS